MGSRGVWPRIIPVVMILLQAIACGGGGGQGLPVGGGSATVNVTVSDPSTCSAPQGLYSHIYLTIADVRANTSASAASTDTGWIDLTPGLSSSPVQIDLIGSGSLQCSLPAIATGTGIIPATFQQFNVLLLDNSLANKLTSNQCGAAANCVVLAANNSVQPIALSGESQSGITIPPAQIAGSSFTVGLNENKTLNLAVNSCASVVTQNTGQLRLKPVIFAADIASRSTSISGRVVDGVNLGAISGGRVVVALERPDANGVDRVIQATVPDGTGAFSFCSLPTGNYDVVAIAINSLNIAYGATIASGVPAGTDIGNLPIYQQQGANQAAATIAGQITSAGTSSGVSVDLSVSTLQTASLGNNSNLTFTLPQVSPPAPTLSLATGSSTSCPVNTNCVGYTMSVPVANPYLKNFSTIGDTYKQLTGSTPYVVDAVAFVASSGNVADCSPSTLKTASVDVSLGAGNVVNAPGLNFTACR